MRWLTPVLLALILATAPVSQAQALAPDPAPAAHTPKVGYLRVNMPKVPAGASDVDALWARELATHAAVLSVTRAEALDDKAVQQTEWFKSIGDRAAAEQWLALNSAVQPVEGTALIVISLRGNLPPQDAKTLITAIGDRYIQRVAEAEKNRLYDQSRRENRLKDTLRIRFNELQREIMQKLAGDHSTPVDQERLALLREERRDLLEQLSEVDRRMESLNQLSHTPNPVIEWAAKP